MYRRFPAFLAFSVLLASWGSTRAQELPAFTSVQRSTNGEVALKLTLPAGALHRIESSADLSQWTGVATLAGGTGIKSFTDTSAAAQGTRFYRAVTDPDPNAITGDHLSTTAGDLVVHPVNHASFVLRWGDKFIYNDPVGSSSLYAGLPKPDLILVSHSHGDHFVTSTLTALRKDTTLIIAPAAVYTSLSSTLKAVTIPLANGQETNVVNLRVLAIPAYNANHPKGTGNGYVVDLGGRRLFMSGDTGNIAEMRALTGVDMAFVCMNVPYTMTISEAVTAVRAFKPGITYPYHYRNQDNSYADVNSFKRQINTDPGLEVRLRAWY